MLQMSKIIRSRDEWKRKAVMRANELREFRKTNKHNQDKIAELKAQIKAMERASEEEKKRSRNPQSLLIFKFSKFVPYVLC